MKRTMLFFVLPLLLILSGCNKSQQLVNYLDGKWQIQNIVAPNPTLPIGNEDA